MHSAFDVMGGVTLVVGDGRYAAMTMVHREQEYLEIWLRHYEKIVGREHIYIVAHGGDSKILEIARDCRILYLPRLSVDGSFDARRFEFLNSLAGYLLSQYDGLIAGDVDELLFVDPALGCSLVEFAEKHRGTTQALRAFGMNILELASDTEIDLRKTILSQRRFARCEQDYCKPLLAFSRPDWSVGYHSAKCDSVLPDGLYLAHLHYCSTKILASVAEHRSTTLSENPIITESRKFRAAWWGQRELKAKKYLDQMNLRPVEQLDRCIAALRDELRRNVVQSRWGGRGYVQMVFDRRQDFIVELPERFGEVL